jgi:cytochrome c
LQKNLRLFGFFSVLLGLSVACTPNEKSEGIDTTDSKKLDYIRPVEGENESPNLELIKKGKVLISYGDCNTCHTDEKRSKGPAFLDIAKRYPSNQVYIDLLARKVISGGTGSWGNPVMAPHPNLENSEAEAMVTYILSLDL